MRESQRNGHSTSTTLTTLTRVTDRISGTLLTTTMLFSEPNLLGMSMDDLDGSNGLLMAITLVSPGRRIVLPRKRQPCFEKVLQSELKI